RLRNRNRSCKGLSLWITIQCDVSIEQDLGALVIDDRIVGRQIQSPFFGLELIESENPRRIERSVVRSGGVTFDRGLLSRPRNLSIAMFQVVLPTPGCGQGLTSINL